MEEQERLSRALRKNDKLLLDIGIWSTAVVFSFVAAQVTKNLQKFKVWKLQNDMVKI